MNNSLFTTELAGFSFCLANNQELTALSAVCYCKQRAEGEARRLTSLQLLDQVSTKLELELIIMKFHKNLFLPT